MSAIWRWFTSLSQTSRLALGGGLIAYGLVGEYVTDRAADAFGLTPTEEDKQKLKEMIPKISVVEKNQTQSTQDRDIESQLAELRKSR
ncbi:hypothetical protein H072_4424 [Dactylellina haptotyla CBS 200.50]|uniref:Uncharacterized protein n=1 Tax=Dactylellina haptotyla (strain CBS 200.50) TaxID=1284197 RepID=S8AFJ5_DACHA|nr:hypothetical protein H072_4424 [Dactylellina haptotyla CBS 200.50]